MKQLLFIPVVFFVLQLNAQDKPAFTRAPDRTQLPDIKKAIRTVQGNVAIYTQNTTNLHSQEHDVNSIILDIEKYIDSMPRNKSYADQLLMKLFNPIRHFFLTTTNKTTVATSFLYSGTPYQFCNYNDTATVLYFYAVRDGNTYNLAKTTERKIFRTSFEQCLLPSLKALDELKEGDIKYAALSVYYGCKDTREGAPAGQIAPFCLTLLARIADLQQFAEGMITAKGLVAVSELYLSDEEGATELRRVQMNID
ncbi:MAG: hypothetical protein K0Q79_2330 [Flavipsychrobacter sp.]|nr:hypothetical protein [Flavipsychrobacter sp.]